MKIKLTVLVVVSVMQAAVFAAPVVSYDLTQLLDNTWLCEYTISNDSESDIYQFSLWFDYNLYSDLSIESTPQINAAWDQWLGQPNVDFAADGIFDALALDGSQITQGDSVSGFAVSFTWLGTDTPGCQLFEIYDPDDYTSSVFSGDTVLVPEPISLLLTLMGVPFLRRSNFAKTA